MVIAIDPSLRQTGLYVEETGKTAVIKTSGEQSQALYKIYLQVEKYIATYRPDVIVFEKNDCFGSLGYGASMLYAVIGIITVLGVKHGCTLIGISPMTWKAYIFGHKRKTWPKKGKTKQAIKDYVAAGEIRTGIKFATTDEMDAYMIYKTYKEQKNAGHTA